MEKKYNWDGICIEPQDSYYNELIKNRNCYTDNSLLFSEKDKEFDFSETNDGLAGITEYINKHLDLSAYLHVNSYILSNIGSTFLYSSTFN